MDAIVNDLSNLLVPLIVSAVLAGLKWAAPRIRDKVPNLLWPVAVFGLARAGSAVCSAAGLPCSGNPLAWSPETVQALAVAGVAVMVHQIAKAGKPQVDAVLTKLGSLTK